MVNVIEKFKKHLLESGRSRATLECYLTDIKAFYKHLNSNEEDLINANEKTIIDFINMLDKSKANSSVYRMTVCLRNFYNFLYGERIITKVPKIHFTSTAEHDFNPEILEPNEINKIINSIDTSSFKGIRDKALLEVAYGAGLRASEIINLKINDVNLETNSIVCSNNNNIRYIPIGKSAKAALSIYIEERLKKSNVDNAFFISIKGEKMTRQGIWRIIKTCSSNVVNKNTITINTFRHSFAAHMLRNGANAVTVKNFLGNKNITKLKYYYDKDNFNDDEVYYKTHPRA